MDVAASERSGKRPSRPAPSARSKRKTPSSPAEPVSVPTVGATETPGDQRNVGSLEGALSLTLGVLLVVAALFPRSIRQLLMLGIGGGLAYRGMKGRCAVYEATGINTAKAPLLRQLGDKLAG